MDMTRDAVDRNKTVWQRIQSRLEPEFGRHQADQIATRLLPAVVAERVDAVRSVADKWDQIVSRTDREFREMVKGAR